MQISSVLTAVGLTAGPVSAYLMPSGGAYASGYHHHHPGHNGTGIYTITRVWDAVTTFCPEPTTLYFNNRTYTIDEPTTFVIPNCPCTQTYTTDCKDCHESTTYVMPTPSAQTAPAETATATGEPGPSGDDVALPTATGEPGPSGDDVAPQTGTPGVTPSVAPGAEGVTPTAAGKAPSGTMAAVATAGAEKRAGAAGIALAAGLAAVLAL